MDENQSKCLIEAEFCLQLECLNFPAKVRSTGAILAIFGMKIQIFAEILFLAGKIKYLKNCFSVFLTWKFKWDFQSLKANPEDQIYIDQFFTAKIPDYFHNIF